MQKGATVTERDELSEGIRALRATEERCMSDLAVGVVLNVRCEGAAEGSQSRGRGDRCRH